MKRKLLLALFIQVAFLCNIPAAYAGVFELGASASYKQTQISDLNKSESISYTGSLSYYFMNMSALEFSYTQGESILTVQPSTSDPQTKYKTNSEFLGLDLVFSFAGRAAPIQPYVKGGVAQVNKQLTTITNIGTIVEKSPTQTVPSYGIGLKIKLSQTLSLKIGYDAWLTKTSSTQSEDAAARAGISWLF